MVTFYWITSVGSLLIAAYLLTTRSGQIAKQCELQELLEEAQEDAAQESASFEKWKKRAIAAEEKLEAIEKVLRGKTLHEIEPPYTLAPANKHIVVTKTFVK